MSLTNLLGTRASGLGSIALGLLPNPITFAARFHLGDVHPTWDQGSRETLPLAFDFGSVLSEVETITSTAVTLTTAGGVSYPAGLYATATTYGGTVVQWVGGLTAGQTYRLRVTATTTAAKVWETVLTINCPSAATWPTPVSANTRSLGFQAQPRVGVAS